VITLPMAAASQRKAVFDALAGGPIPKPAGPRMAMRVVGIVAAENEFSYGQGVTYTLYPGRGFAVATKGSPALTSYYVRLRHGQADFARFEAFTSRLGIAAGRAIWRVFAISLGVVPVPVVEARLIVALAAGALIAAIALAAVPAMSAARSRPGQLLRTE
jgi:hypothetical protein